MADFPGKCPSCNEPNRNNLNFCAVCGRRFQRKVHNPQPTGARNKILSKEQKLKVKKLKKKKELVDLYKRKKITTEQFTKGMTKLGYSTDIEKATEFKKYIREQIKVFEKLDVSGVQEGEYHFDPNESKAQLPRDEFGNVITDFSVKPTPSASNHNHHETYAEPKMVTSRPPPGATSSGSPLFGESLFANSGPSRQKTPRKEIPKAKLKRDIPVGRRTHHKIRGRDLDWDEDEEEEEELIEEEMTEEEEEEFEIDLDEEDFEGEKGWWDDEEWELDWDDEDEEEEWEIDLDEEDEWETWEGGEEDEEDEELPPGIRVDFEDDEEEDEDDDVFDPTTYYDEDEEEEELIEEEDDEEEDDWDEPRRRRRR
jgi:hypothetical protein